MKHVWWLGFVVVVVVACRDKTEYEPWKPDPATVDRRIDQLGPTDRDRELRLKGTIAAPFEVAGSGAERTITFSLVENKATIRVVATGILPDRFREHMIGVVFGRWDGDKFHAHDVAVAAPEFPREPKVPSP